MEKELLEKIERLDTEELLALRVYVDAVMRDFNVCPADQCTDAPTAAPPEAGGHSPE